MVPSPILLLVSGLTLASVAASAALPPAGHQIRSDATSHDQKLSYPIEIRDTVDPSIHRVRARGKQIPRAEGLGAPIPGVSVPRERARNIRIPRAEAPGAQIPGPSIPRA